MQKLYKEPTVCTVEIGSQDVIRTSGETPVKPPYTPNPYESGILGY